MTRFEQTIRDLTPEILAKYIETHYYGDYCECITNEDYACPARNYCDKTIGCYQSVLNYFNQEYKGEDI